MIDETILTNADLVLPDAVLRGTLVLRGGTIADIQPGVSGVRGALDMVGDTLIPGIVDLHTDNLERQVQPRDNARWPSRSAMLAHDAQCAVAGVTTVFDALCLGNLGFEKERDRTFREGMADIDVLTEARLMRVEHFLHLRCEVPAHDVLALFDPVADHPRVRMVSLMDHTPGVGQYADLDYYRALRRSQGADEDEIARRIIDLGESRGRVRGPNRRGLLARLSGRDVAVASHDDRTEDEVAENAAAGISVSEFPVTMAAARAAKAYGMAVVGGAPNIVRGGSHSGNVAVRDLVAAEAVDALASDYVPHSLVEAAFLCASWGVPLCAAVGLVTAAPARIARFDDRGRLVPGLRADVVRVRVRGELAVVLATWSAGERVA